MVLLNITEVHNDNIPAPKPIKEAMDIYVKGIPEGLSRRNGAVTALCGAGGSGKTNMLMNLFQDKALYKGKYHNVYYFVPEGSFKSITKHPFRNHDKVYHELDIETLKEIVNGLEAKKNEAEANDDELEYSVIIIDDFASSLKDKAMVRFLNSVITRTRHLQLHIIICLQSYLYCPLIIRKQFTYVSLFKPRNKREWETIMNELINLNKDDALKLYHYIFDEKYTHLDIDNVENKMYKNFNELTLHED